MSLDPILVIGAGQAGLQAAEALRAGGFAGDITLLGDEAYGPYHRPPLSKAWLAGTLEANQLSMRAPELLARKGITLRTACRVVRIDRTQRQVHLADGQALPYGGLVLATGARPRPLPVPGGQAPGVWALRSRDDASGLAAALAQCATHRQPVVVVGGGFIGLEVAATARHQGLQVTVVESAPRLLGRVLAPVLSDWFAALHRQQGVTLELGQQVSAITTNAQGQAQGVALGDGRVLPAALVVVGIGVTANDALARDAGLDCDHGVVVDACGRTKDPLIVAAGDCTARRLDDGRLLRLESVHNATEQGKSAAAALLGQSRPFIATPWFWSDQYGIKLQMAGLSQGADTWAVRGDTNTQSFSVYHYQGDRLLAVDSVNAPKDHLQARKLLDTHRHPTPDQVRDLGVDLNPLLAESGTQARAR